MIKYVSFVHSKMTRRCIWNGVTLPPNTLSNQAIIISCHAIWWILLVSKTLFYIYIFPKLQWKVSEDKNICQKSKTFESTICNKGSKALGANFLAKRAQTEEFLLLYRQVWPLRTRLKNSSVISFLPNVAGWAPPLDQSTQVMLLFANTLAAWMVSMVGK